MIFVTNRQTKFLYVLYIKLCENPYLDNGQLEKLYAAHFSANFLCNLWQPAVINFDVLKRPLYIYKSLDNVKYIHMYVVDNVDSLVKLHILCFCIENKWKFRK